MSTRSPVRGGDDAAAPPGAVVPVVWLGGPAPYSGPERRRRPGYWAAYARRGRLVSWWTGSPDLALAAVVAVSVLVMGLIAAGVLVAGRG